MNGTSDEDELDDIVIHSPNAVSDWEHFYEELDNGEWTNDNFMLALEEVLADHENDSSRGLYFTHADTKGDIKLTFDESRKYTWEIGKNMINTTKKNVREKVGKPYIALKDIVMIFFAENGPISQVILEEIGISYSEFLTFMSTWSVLHAYNLSITRLWSDNSCIDTTGLMGVEEYTNIWQKINTRHDQAPGTYARKQQQLYQKIQQRANELFHRLHICNNDGRIIVSLDDDKAHYAGQKGTDTCGLKPTVHAVCRRRGYVNHQAVEPVTGVMLNSQVEEVGDTTIECYKRIIRSIFGAAMDLVRAIFCSDRGYWKESLISDVILYNGGDVHGTLARQEWVPFTYDQNVKGDTTRKVLRKTGPQTYYHAHCNPPHGRKKLTVGALRNGTGSVSIGMSTLYRDNHFECVLDNPNRAKQCINETLALSPSDFKSYYFRHFGGQYEYKGSANALLGALPIQHVTERQGTPEWHLLRRFVISGYTAAMLVGVMVRIDSGKPVCDQLAYVHTVKTYFSTLDGTCGAADPTEEETTNSGRSNIGDATNVDSTSIVAEADIDDSSTNSIGVPSSNSASNEAREILDQCISDYDYKTATLDGLASRTPQLVSEILVLMGGKPSRNNNNANIKKVKEWLLANEGERPFLWLTNNQLIDKFCLKYGRNPPSKISGGKKKWLLNALATGWEGGRGDCMTLLDAVVRSSFLPPLKGTSAELCELGHKMEPEYGRNLLVATKGGLTLGDGKVLEILHLCRVGLLRNEERTYQAASPDFIAHAKIDGEEHLIVVEMKARCTGSTAQREADRINSLCATFTYVTSSSNTLRQHIENRSEAGQLLHLASTTGIKFTLLAVGDKIGLTSGALVEFEDDLLHAYQSCMHDLYNSTLRCFHDNNIALPINDIESSLAKAKVPMDIDTFVQTYQLRKAMDQPEHLPLPALTRMIPMLHQFWNDTKGGSDSNSKQYQRHFALLPVQSPSTTILDRQLLTIMVEIHAINKMFISNENLDVYGSVKNWRQACNSKMTLFDTFMNAADIFQQLLQERESNKSSPQIITPPKQHCRGSKRTRTNEIIQWASNSIGFSPRRDKRARLESPRDMIDRATADIFHSCNGFPVLLRNKDDPTKTKGGGCVGLCVVCGSRTRWYCPKCRQFLCHGTSRPEREVDITGNNKGKQKNMSSKLRPYWESISAEGKVEKLGVYSCFMHNHENSFLPTCINSDGATMLSFD